MTAKEIKVLRKKLKLTQEKLAQKLRVSVATVSRWERGKVKPHEINTYNMGMLLLAHGEEKAI